MKTNNFLLKSAIVLSALIIGSATGYAQQINKRERILKVLDQSKPNEYVPAAFFLHFPDKLGYKAVADHVEFYEATNMDFVKVFYEILVPTIDIKKGTDWNKVPVYDEEFFAPQIEVIADLARRYKKEAFIIPTVYSPYLLAIQTLGKEKGNVRNLKALSEDDPEAFGHAIKNLALSIGNYLHAASKAGADGFYVSSHGGDGNTLKTEIWEKYVRKWDKYISEVADTLGEINILHIDDNFAPFKDAQVLYNLKDYPGTIINVPHNFSDGSRLDLKEAQRQFGRPIFGGLDRLGVIATGTVEEAKKAVDDVLSNAPANFILGADCTIPSNTDYDKLRAIIEYAHTWRQTHK